MLSGIGPAEHARAPRHRRAGRSAGRRPQPAGPLRGRRRQPDELRATGRCSKDARFAEGRSAVRRVGATRTGVYTTNGAVLAVIKRSRPERPLPDLFIFALLGRSAATSRATRKLFAKHRNYLTWAILKAHTKNRAGNGDAALRRSARRAGDQLPLLRGRERPAGRRSRRRSSTASSSCARMTGAARKDEADRRGGAAGRRTCSRDDRPARSSCSDNAWGHHASCTCPIGTAASTAASSTATSACTAPRACASSTPRSSRDPGLLHRQRDLHDRREGQRRDPGRRRAAASRCGAHGAGSQTRSSLMRKAGFVFIVLLLAELGSARGQDDSEPLPRTIRMRRPWPTRSIRPPRSAASATPTSTSSGASRLTPMPPSPRCSTSSNSGSTTSREGRSTTSASVVTPASAPPWASGATSPGGIAAGPPRKGSPA